MGARNRQRPSWIRGRDAIKILNGLYPRSPRTPQSSSMIRGAAKASWKLELNQAFAAYATAAGFRIHACEGYDPESKGKVEAGVKYVKGNALAGEVFDDWDHLEAHVRQWLDEVANVRRHGTTGEAPQVRFERDEQAQLGPYLTPASLAPQASAETRKVDKTGLLSWRANKYSAPMAYQG